MVVVVELCFTCSIAGPNGAGNGLTGSYYNNRWLQDTPVMSRVDKFIDFEWGTDLVTASAKDYVSVRWTGYIMPENAETYTFFVDVDVRCHSLRMLLGSLIILFRMVPGFTSMMCS